MNLGTALVTGGASGMGLAIVERLARDGFSVVMADRNGALAEQESQALRARGLPVAHRGVDLTDEAATRAMVSSLPALAALVNNAGLFDERKFFDVGTDDFRRAFDVNLLAVATLTQEAARTMAAGAKIVNIASRAYLGAKNHPHYVASKAALVGYTRAAAMELASRGILVNAIAPGLIGTETIRAELPELFDQFVNVNQLIRRVGAEADIVSAMLFLVSDQASFITGETLKVSGGFPLNI